MDETELSHAVTTAPDPSAVDWDQCYNSYVEYGRQFVRLIATL